MGRAVYENTSTGTERARVRGLAPGATLAASDAAAPYRRRNGFRRHDG